MKKILILSEFKSQIISALSLQYQICEDDADLTIFDFNGQYDVPAGKTLAIFKNEVLAGTYSDFITYPFRNDELLCRVERLVSGESVFKNGNLIIDTARCLVILNGVQVHLTMLEYKLLCLLAAKCTQTVDYQTIMRELWGSPIGSEIRSVRVFVNALRKKLGNDELIKNVMGKGYVMPKLSD